MLEYIPPSVVLSLIVREWWEWRNAHRRQRGGCPLPSPGAEVQYCWCMSWDKGVYLIANDRNELPVLVGGLWERHTGSQTAAFQVRSTQLGKVREWRREKLGVMGSVHA